MFGVIFHEVGRIRTFVTDKEITVDVTVEQACRCVVAFILDKLVN